MKIGILGGSFDPVHWGHLVIAEEARVRVGLDRVVFVPAGKQWLKGRELLDGELRLEMLSLALAANPHFLVSRTEIDRAGPSYTVDTLAYFQQEYKGGELFFILGWDSLAELPRWKEPGRIIQLCHLVGVPRPGFPPPDLAALENYLPGLARRLVLLEGPLIGLSSTQIRQRVAQGLSIRYLVPKEVEEYILARGLYRWNRLEG